MTGVVGAVAIVLPVAAGCENSKDVSSAPAPTSQMSETVRPSPSPTPDICKMIGLCSLSFGSADSSNHFVVTGTYEPANFKNTMPIYHDGKQVATMGDQDQFTIQCEDASSITVTLGKVTGQIGLTHQ